MRERVSERGSGRERERGSNEDRKIHNVGGDEERVTESGSGRAEGGVTEIEKYPMCVRVGKTRE